MIRQQMHAMTARKSYRYLSSFSAATVTPAPAADQFEFDESEVWSASVAAEAHPEPKRVLLPSHQSPRPARKLLRVKSDRLPGSLPVNVPDWAKILGGEYRRAEEDEYEGKDEDDNYDDDGNERIPPHEYLARTRGASLSVHEGEGRTLKGRDLSRVRNAIWKQFGFED